jgi:hypothetical protein
MKRGFYAIGDLINADCKRCGLPFRYLCKGGRHRYFCEPCREIEMKENTAVTNAVAKERRAEQRRIAKMIHQEAENAA